LHVVLIGLDQDLAHRQPRQVLLVRYVSLAGQ
jgi:hypothetical protein